MVSRIPLGNICDKKIDTLSSQYDGKVEYIDISSIDNVEKVIVNTQAIDSKEAPSRARQLVKNGDILVSTVRPNLNAVAVIDRESNHILVASTGYCVLRCNSETDNHYVFHFCQSPYFIDDMVRQATGASYPAVSSSIVRSCLIPSRSLEEQRCIATALDKLADLISLRKQQLAKLDELVKARFVEMFGDPQYNTKLLPCYTLGELGTWSSGGTPSRANAKYFGGNIDWYSAGELNSLFLVESVEKITKDAIENSSAKIFSKGSLLIGMYDTAAFKMGILKKDSASNQACACIEPNEKINVIWLYYELTLMKDFFLCQRRGVRQKNLNLSMIKEFLIPVSDLKGQDDFAAFVEQEVALKLTIQQSLDKLEVLKKSLMQDYFG